MKDTDDTVTIWMVWNDGRKGERISDKPEFYMGHDPKTNEGRYYWRAVTRDMPNGEEVLAIADLIGEDERSIHYSPPSWSRDFEIPRSWLEGFGEEWR